MNNFNSLEKIFKKIIDIPFIKIPSAINGSHDFLIVMLVKLINQY